MKVLRQILDFYLDASFHVALAVYALVKVSGIRLQLADDDHLNKFLFFGSIVCYNFMKYGVEAEKYILVTNARHRPIQWLSFIALGIAAYHAYFLNFEVYVGVAGLVVLTGFYAIPVVPKTGNLRSLGGLKIFIVALVWAGATVLLPVLAVEQNFNGNVWVQLLQHFLLVLILLLPFEVRDLAYDSPEMRTLPQRLGIKNIKRLGLGALIVVVLTNFLIDPFLSLYHDLDRITADAILVVITGLLLLMTKREQSKYFASFWVESVPIMWWVLLLVFEVDS